MQINDKQITIFDIGCRFGIHPTWKTILDSEFLHYYAFDIDDKEITRLKKKYSGKKNYMAINEGFSSEETSSQLNILAHHGQNSFLKPNLNSHWFRYRSTDGDIQQKKNYQLTTLESYCNLNKIYPDFLKIDTEGYDYHVLSGAKRILDDVIAIRCEVQFDETYENAILFPEIFNLLKKHKFQLANLEYDGKGIPSSYFCPNQNKFGLMSDVDAVFIKNNSELQTMKVTSKIKLCLFGFFNHLEDLSNHILINLSDDERKIVNELDIWLEIKRQYCYSTKILLNVPGDSFLKAKADYQKIFEEDFPQKHQFFESDFLNPV